MYIKVRVTPNSKKESFKKLDNDTFEISVKEKAERNLVNNKIIELLADYFSIQISGIKIITGHHSPRKILFIKSN